MRKLLILLFIPFLFACNNGPQSGAILTGTIENLETDFFQLGGPGGARDSIMVDEEGKFTFKLQDLTEPYAYYFISGEEFFRFYVAPGMNLDIILDQKSFIESIAFKGKGSDINNYIANKTRVFGDRMDYEVYKKNTEDFQTWAENDLVERQALLKETEKKNINNPYWIQEEGEILYTWANNNSSYPSMHKYYAELEEFEVPEDFYNYKKELDVNDAKYIGSAAFQSYISTYIREEVAIISKDLRNENPDYKPAKILTLETASKLLTEKKVLENFLFASVKGYMSYYDLDLIKDEIDFFYANCENQEYINKFNIEYEEWKKLSKGMPGMNFKGEDLEGKMVHFSDFKGKYVYVDVWATWCGPCKYEIPFLKKLEKDYHGKNIVFISYSIDEDKDAWLKFVPENELGGVQIIGENAWESEMTTHYKVRGVPTFMFFDTEGKIISVNMTRPSNQKTRDSFDSYEDL
ncbi:redoxin family protein [Bacteroidota bacterium]